MEQIGSRIPMKKVLYVAVMFSLLLSITYMTLNLHIAINIKPNKCDVVNQSADLNRSRIASIWMGSIGIAINSIIFIFLIIYLFIKAHK